MDIQNITNDNINNLCIDEILKQLIKLSILNNIDIFKKQNTQLLLKSKSKLLKECISARKKEIKSSSYLLSKLNNNTDLNTIKEICTNLENKINNIDRFINYVNIIDISQYKTFKINFIDSINIPSIPTNFKYIEYYSNC